MNIPGYSEATVRVDLPASLEDACDRGSMADIGGLARQMIGDYLFNRMTLERNELIRLRERVAGLLERNTSLVHTKRDLEAQIKGHMEARKQAWETIQKLHARDIPIREIPICSRRDAN